MFKMNFANKKFKVVEKFWIFIAISLIIILAGCLDMVIRGMNIGLDFSAGSKIIVTVKNVDEFDEAQFKTDFDKWFSGDRDLDGKLDGGEVAVYETAQTQTSVVNGITSFEFRIGTTMKVDGQTIDLSQTELDENNEERTKLFLETESIKEDIMDDVVKYLQDNYDAEIGEFTGNIEVTSNMADNTIMLYTIKTAIWVVALGILAMLIYIGIRFTWLSGLSAIIALAHDVLIMIAMTSLFQIPVNSTFIAAVITIIGYSINSTIVIFDRIREIEALPSSALETDSFIANRSIANTLSRSILTTLTTFAMIALLAVFGESSIREFAIPIMFGLVAGAYSSVLLSASLWVKLRKVFKMEGTRTSATKKKKSKYLATKEAK